MKVQLTASLALGSIFCMVCCVAAQSATSQSAVTVYEDSLTIPTYEHIGREMEPPLFSNSSVLGLYPFTTYLAPFRSDDPKPETYRTVVLENEYLRLTYIPDFGDHIFSLYDKIHKREVFYRNDVIKPTMFNPRLSWPQSGIEVTGPYDIHTLTLHSEPFWSHSIVHHADGSVSLVLGEFDPVYHSTVDLTATLHPGLAALEISVFCYNRNDGRIPQMFWINTAVPSTEKTRMIYPMTRTIGHTTGEVSDWPLYNGIDYSWDRNNKHMLGVFGIDSYDNFAGAYQFDHDFGVFRYADRRVVQGMKMWTFGYGPGAAQMQQTYTDHAGPYIEIQSGRYVWDGHYEWIAPHKVESWNEWWIPVAGIGGLTTMTRDVALNLDVKPDSAAKSSSMQLALTSALKLEKAHLLVTATSGKLLDTTVDLTPGEPLIRTVSSIKANADGLKKLTVIVTGADGVERMHYVRPDENPGRKQYSAFAKALEEPQKTPEQMSVEELVAAAEFKLKETNPTGMRELVELALKRDPGYSRAHLLLGVYDYGIDHYADAASELTKATLRDPYLDEGWYYLALSQLALGEKEQAERNFYYVMPGSAYFSAREYQLGKLALIAADNTTAATHLQSAVAAYGLDLNARLLLAVVERSLGKTPQALEQLSAVEHNDPANRFVFSERFLLDGNAKARQELIRLMGGQTQEALDVANFYGGVGRWSDAVRVLRLVETDNKDPWGTSPLYYYTLAFALSESGNATAAPAYRKKARAATEIVDRFPYRRESEAPLASAVAADPHDAVARFNLACLLYFLGRHEEAIQQWQSAIAIDPAYFSARRTLGLALAEQTRINEGIPQLEKAVALRPEHVRTFNDLSSLYARAGRFDDQIALLRKALDRTPADDDLTMALLNAYLVKGRYEEADKIVTTHTFAPRHRSTTLRDAYRELRYGMGGAAFRKGDYARALELFQSSLKPPVTLGVDDFQFESTPRAYYYIGRSFEALGRKQEAEAAYKQSISGIDLLTGDRDSWSSDNFFAVLALDRLGNTARAGELVPHFEGFARTEMDETNPGHRGHARYLLGLVERRSGHTEKARTYMNDALHALPDLLGPRYELRNDTVDPLADNGMN